jgi:hypothetical protein
MRRSPRLSFVLHYHFLLVAVKKFTRSLFHPGVIYATFAAILFPQELSLKYFIITRRKSFPCTLLKIIQYYCYKFKMAQAGTHPILLRFTDIGGPTFELRTGDIYTFISDAICVVTDEDMAVDRQAIRGAERRWRNIAGQGDPPPPPPTRFDRYNEVHHGVDGFGGGVLSVAVGAVTTPCKSFPKVSYQILIF